MMFARLCVPVENSLMFVSALGRSGVPFELHLYERVPHGFGPGTARGNRPADPVLMTWPAHAAAWLRLRGFAAKRRTVVSRKTKRRVRPKG